MKTEIKQKLRDVFSLWWGTLYDERHDGAYAKRGEIAQLRRLACLPSAGGDEPDIVAALCIDSFRDLYKKIESEYGHLSCEDEHALFVVAATLARIRANDKNAKSTAALLGGRESESRLLKEARFLRLIRTDKASDLFDQARRLCALLKNKAPVGDLALSLFLWRHDTWIRRNWAMHYYGLFEPSSSPSQS